MARTRAQRRGRPRKQGQREENGRPQRETVAEIRMPGVEARMRLLGLSATDASERLAGYAIGQLYLREKTKPTPLIDLVDVEIVDDYVEVVARFMALTNPQHPFPKAMDYLATVKGIGSDPSQAYIDRVRRAYAAWTKPLNERCSGAQQMAFHNMVFHDHMLTGDQLMHVIYSIRVLRAAFRA